MPRTQKAPTTGATVDPQTEAPVEATVDTLETATVTTETQTAPEAPVTETPAETPAAETPEAPAAGMTEDGEAKTETPEAETPRLAAPLIRMAEILRAVNAMQTAEEGAEVKPLETAPGEMEALIRWIETNQTAASVSVPARGTARPIQPPVVNGASGKVLPKLWTHTDTADAAVRGPYLIGDTTRVGWVVRDTRTGKDEEFGRGKDYRAQATAWADAALKEVPAEEVDALKAAAVARVTHDGRYMVAR